MARKRRVERHYSRASLDEASLRSAAAQVWEGKSQRWTLWVMVSPAESAVARALVAGPLAELIEHAVPGPVPVGTFVIEARPT